MSKKYPGDDIFKILFLGGLLGVDHMYRRTQQTQSSYYYLTSSELQEIERKKLLSAKPFNFT